MLCMTTCSSTVSSAAIGTGGYKLRTTSREPNEMNDVSRLKASAEGARLSRCWPVKLNNYQTEDQSGFPSAGVSSTALDQDP